MKNQQIIDEISQLETLAADVLKMKQHEFLRRPIFIEFCGCPKSGKTSSINSLNIFLKRNGFKTIVVSEKASICPIADKNHPHFNLWTMCATIKDLIKYLSVNENSQYQADVIIADRGFFDALCWFDRLRDIKGLDSKSFAIIENFITMDMFLNKVDLVYVFTASPDVSMEREYANLLTRKEGSIMNSQTLAEYKIAVEQTIGKYGSLFRKIEKIDTGGCDQNQVGKEVTSITLNILKDLLIEKIGYLKWDIRKYLDVGINELSDLRNKVSAEMLTINYLDRDKVEDGDYIQPIPIVVLTNKNRDKVLVLKKPVEHTGKNSPENNKSLLYAGGHIRIEDSLTAADSFLGVIRNALHREIEEELGKKIVIDNTIEPFLIYSNESPKSQKHLAVCFVTEVDFETTKFRLNPNELLAKGKGKSGKAISIDELCKSENELESWSIAILKKVFSRIPNTSEPLF